VLNPSRSLPELLDVGKPEDNSVAIKLAYGEFSALFAGDMSAQSEQRLLLDGTVALESDVLLVAQHGSDEVTSRAFLQAVDPGAVIISVGHDNAFGFPHPETLYRINSEGVRHGFRTDIDGTVLLLSNGGPEFTFESLKSEKTIIVPEFSFVAPAAAIAIASMLALIRTRLGKLD
jgi:beta-lactamase superfamily II metal-dependent hydrolase